MKAPRKSKAGAAARRYAARSETTGLLLRDGVLLPVVAYTRKAARHALKAMTAERFQVVEQ